MADKRLSVAIGSDHAGFELKEALKSELKAMGYNIEDLGAFFPDPVDYPDVAKTVSEAVAIGKYDRGILICGTGVGVTITANKIKSIRAFACSEPYSAKMARAHNNANVVGIGARVVGLGTAVEIAQAFLETQFEAGSRHEKRVDKINELDKC